MPHKQRQNPIIQTPISEMFGLKYPIICGAMMWLGIPRLCEVVADAAGIEEGGHPLDDDVSTMILTPKLVDELDLPVVTVGGIADGRSMAAALALGASGVMMATRFMATTDCCELHDNIRQELVARQEYETELIGKTLGLQARAPSNAVVREINKVEAVHGGLKEMMPFMTGMRSKKAWVNGDVDLAVMTVGQTIGRIEDVPSTAELLDRMAKEALQASAAVQGLYST